MAHFLCHTPFFLDDRSPNDSFYNSLVRFLVCMQGGMSQSVPVEYQTYALCTMINQIVKFKWYNPTAKINCKLKTQAGQS